MDKSWLEYCATREQLETFDETGYLIVEDALDPGTTARLTQVVERIDAGERHRLGLEPHQLLQKWSNHPTRGYPTRSATG